MLLDIAEYKRVLKENMKFVNPGNFLIAQWCQQNCRNKISLVVDFNQLSSLPGKGVSIEGLLKQYWPVGKYQGVVMIDIGDMSAQPTVGSTIPWAGDSGLYIYKAG